MGSLKTLAYVGAVAMVAASAVTAATAADLSPAPAPLMAPPPAPMIETASGIYLRGDVGVGNMGQSSVTSVITDTVTNWAPGAPYTFDKKAFSNNAFVSLGISYQFNSFFRVDVTGEMRTDTRFTGIQSYTSTNPLCVSGRCYDAYDASIKSNVFLVNGYVDLGTWRGITPFIGAGVGIASHKVNGLQDIGVQPGGGFGFAQDKSSTKLAWALMAGLGYEVTRNLKMEVGYRYLNMGTVNSGTIACQNTAVCPLEMHKYKMQSHDVKVGFRYLLNDDAPAAAAPVMYAAPAAAPVMRKY